MYKKTITYTDYDGNTRTEDFFFNINKKELIELQVSADGGIDKLINKVINEKNQKKIIELFEKIIQKSYGEKSLDGKMFKKSDEILNNFMSTEAYSNLFMELATDSKAASDFINGVLPTLTNEEKQKIELQAKAISEQNNQQNIQNIQK